MPHFSINHKFRQNQEITTVAAISILQSVIDDEVKSVTMERDKKTHELRKTKIS